MHLGETRHHPATDALPSFVTKTTFAIASATAVTSRCLFNFWRATLAIQCVTKKNGMPLTTTLGLRSASRLRSAAFDQCSELLPPLMQYAFPLAYARRPSPHTDADTDTAQHIFRLDNVPIKPRICAFAVDRDGVRSFCSFALPLTCALHKFASDCSCSLQLHPFCKYANQRANITPFAFGGLKRAPSTTTMTTATMTTTTTRNNNNA